MRGATLRRAEGERDGLAALTPVGFGHLLGGGELVWLDTERRGERSHSTGRGCGAARLEARNGDGVDARTAAELCLGQKGRETDAPQILGESHGKRVGPHVVDTILMLRCCLANVVASL